MGYSLWGCKELDTTKQLTHTHTHTDTHTHRVVHGMDITVCKPFSHWRYLDYFQFGAITNEVLWTFVYSLSLSHTFSFLYHKCSSQCFIVYSFYWFLSSSLIFSPAVCNLLLVPSSVFLILDIFSPLEGWLGIVKYLSYSCLLFTISFLSSCLYGI